MEISYADFLRFLRENNCEQQFIRAFHDQNGNHFIDEGLWKLMDTDECFFNRAFNWARTVEGRDYWHRINDLWFEMYAPKQTKG